MTNIPFELTNAIENDKLIIFAGAGLSKQFNFPDWKNLVVNIINSIHDAPTKISSLLPALESGGLTPIEVLDKLKDYRKEVLSEIERCFKLNESTDFSRHREILKLSSKIITTNFDKSFESADKGLEMIAYKSTFKVSQLQGKDKYIFKIHGCIDYPEDCILFSEQYNEHYSGTNASIFELQKLITENTILFIGFSMSDPFVKTVFNFINSIYGGFTNKHYVITTDSTLEKEINLPNIKSIILDDYTVDLDRTIKELQNHKKHEIKIDDKASLENIQSKPSICILYPNPIDKNSDYNIEEIVDTYNSYDVKVDVEYFSIENLRDLKCYDYILIFTQSFKNSILSEDEYLKSKYISLKDVEDNLVQTKLKFIAIFYSGENIKIDAKFNLPHIFVSIDKYKFKDLLKDFNYKLFKKADLSLVLNTFECSNSNFKIVALNKGTSERITHKPIISKYIDQKQLSRFIGRKSDLESVIRKITEKRFNNNLLTIKGSGGIGKTTIICKAAIELANRKYFQNGIHFISCQKINTIENFQYQISQCFQLVNSIELRQQIEENILDKSRLIILDNFETVLNLSCKNEIVELVSFILDYSTLVVTSRQILDLEFEEVYELRNFTTDEGVLLFKSYYFHTKETEEKILREQIVEKILNNNPLAIKLIAKGLVNSKDLFQLKEELEEKIFDDEDLEKIFENPEDSNIEKSNSLYQSINYSYLSLTDKEKLTFELLSLFPDGIHFENFKKFIIQSKTNKLSIGDKEIKSLDNKSLLENTNAFLKLQSIISRFADYQFSQKTESEKMIYFTVACDYNNFFLNLLSSNLIGHNMALRINDENTNNYLKIIDNLELVNINKEEKLIFVNNVIDVFRNTNQQNEIFKRSSQLYKYFEDVEDSKLFIDSALLYLEYWTSDFDGPFDKLKEILPINSFNESSFENRIKEQMTYNALSVYANEGYQFNIVKLLLGISKNTLSIDNSLFQLGYIKETLNDKKKNTFSEIFAFENKIIHNKLTIKEIDNYISSIHPKDTLELVQITYLKLKCFGSVTKKDIQKLVVTNPYTRGMISLMYAILEIDKISKKKLFLKALSDLVHIKYYYVDSMLLFCNFLKESNDEDFSKWYTKGQDLAKKFKYRYLYHKYRCFLGNLNDEYHQEDYEQIVPYEQIQHYFKRKSAK